MDEYIVEDDGLTLKFLKNGFIHREAGPAMFWKSNTQYLNLGDEHLYVVKHIELDEQRKKKWLDPNFTQQQKTVYYILDGRPFMEDEFYLEVKKIQAERMQKELDNELKKIDADNNKKHKI
jgi:hypothetical protein